MPRPRYGLKSPAGLNQLFSIFAYTYRESAGLISRFPEKTTPLTDLLAKMEARALYERFEENLNTIIAIINSGVDLERTPFPTTLPLEINIL